jgi:uncharacterized protein (TIGR02246 family)
MITHFLIVGWLGIAQACGAAAQASGSEAVTATIERIEQQLASSWKAGECDTWAALIAPEWSVIHVTGDTITKPQAIAMCRDPQSAVASMSVDQVSVRPYGDTAIATGRTTVTTRGDSPQTIRLRFTDVFVRRDGRWQVVASHATQIP